jgi:dTMP kinase
MTARGRFIVFEGLDGAGTTTQSARLARDLEAAGLRVHLTHEPSELPIGRVVRQAIERRIHLDAAPLALAFAADRLDHVADIDRRLAEGAWVVCDRYVLSSLAYQTADGNDFEWVREINRGAHAPDATVFVDTTVEACVARISARGESTEDRFHREDALRATDAAYRRALASGIDLGALVTVDGDAPQDAVADAIRSGLTSALGSLG